MCFVRHLHQGCRTSTGTRATSACLHSMGWELSTKLNLWLLLSVLPVVVQAWLITLIPERCLCSPRTEPYLSPRDFTLLQQVVAPEGSSSRRSPQHSVVTYTTAISRLLSGPVLLATARQGYENSHENWRQALLWSLIDLFWYQSVLWGSTSSAQEDRLTEVVGSKTCL